MSPRGSRAVGGQAGWWVGGLVSKLEAGMVNR